MEYTYIKLIISTVVGLGLILFRKKFVKLQKNHAEGRNDSVSKKTNEMSTDHMEKVAIVGGLVALAVAALSVVELLG